MLYVISKLVSTDIKVIWKICCGQVCTTMSLVSGKKTTVNPSQKQNYCKLGSQAKENEDKTTTGFGMEDNLVSLQNENQDHNTSVHKDDDDDDDDGKWKGQVKQKANPTADILMWCPDLQEDSCALIHNKWLSDRLIYAAQILLKKQFAHIGGLQLTTDTFTDRLMASYVI